MNKNQGMAAGCFFVCMGLLIFFSNKYQEKKNNMIEDNKFVTVAKVFYIEHRRGFTDARFYFYYNEKRYESGKYIKNSGDIYLGKFYKIAIATNNPEYCKIFLEKEVKDSIEIAKAGFKFD